MSRAHYLYLNALPKQALTAAAGSFARAELGSLTTAAIRAFIRRYGVDMSEAQEPDVARYASFNAFFTRALKPGARPLAADGLLCPVDGAINQCGPIAAGRLIQAKGQDYALTALLGGDVALAESFADGDFATLYLSPRDYHRIHMPCAAVLREMIHVPGSLYPVNARSVAAVPGLFARNERLVCVFDALDEDAALGRFVLVLVGATIVGSIGTTWAGVITPPRRSAPQRTPYDAASAPRFARGDEMGRFELGSTVITVFEPGRMRFATDWRSGRAIRMGEPLGRLR